jgi:SNF2 family DNA or RNA helicase
MTSTLVEPGQLVRVRGDLWVVAEVHESTQPQDELVATRLPGRTLVTLTNVSGDDVGEELSVVWEVEPGHQVVSQEALPEVTADGWDDPQRLGAFLDAARWGSVANADTTTLQSPFRSGIQVHAYQLAPVARALAMPRVNLLIADDVGLGKTIEAGMVIQEMLLRHRARRVLIVCPASLTGKWREEMAQRFGLGFTVLGSEAMRELRRTYGLGQNPFNVYPRVIVSLQWLRSPVVKQLLDEVLLDEARYPGFFDLLVVDEAHHCAPPAPQRGKGYAIDSKQTEAVKRVADWSQHRVFLSATPHNGYSNSWQALLEMLDPQRFTRGMDPDERTLAEVMVRRLKDDVREEVEFQPRHNRAIEVDYSPAELEVQRLLEQYRRARVGETDTQVRANDLVTLMLKRRLFSSPAAFAKTLDGHARAVGAVKAAPQTRADAHDDLAWLDEAAYWDQELNDDEPGSVAEQELLLRVADVTGEPVPDAAESLRALLDWSSRHGQKTDSKAEALVTELKRIRNADPDDRVIIFTEFKDTQTYLANILAARGLGGERLELLYGGMDTAKRERIKTQFQAAPHKAPVRILLATDSAGEGIDLQNYCHRVINYDIPFNPNRLEQRIGRVDRHGQRRPVDVAHFVGAHWEQAGRDSREGDLEFLSRVATKVATERRDLGTVNPVLASAVEAQLLGRPVLIDPLAVQPSAPASLLKAEQDFRAHSQALRDQLGRSRRRLHVAPANVRRVVDTGLAVAQQFPLRDLPDGRVEVPELQPGWERTLTGLADPLTGQRRPLVFDGALVEGRDDDAVHAHLEHPLVAHCARLLRSAMLPSGGRAQLNRVAGVTVSLPEDSDITEPLVVVFARLVVVSADGRRLQEEIMPAARTLPASGRSAKVDLGQLRRNDPKVDDAKLRLRQALEAGFEPDSCRPAPQAAQDRLVEQWPKLGDLLGDDVREAARARLTSLEQDLTRRRQDEVRRVNAVISHLEAALTGLIDGPQPKFLQLKLGDFTEEERRRVDLDFEALTARRDGLARERERDVAEVERRYTNIRDLVFPFAVALCVPDTWGG